jgi:hypothetical protein
VRARLRLATVASTAMRSELRGWSLRTIVRGPVASVLSQATGLLQLGLLLLHGGATRATDNYFYLFGLGLTPVLILVLGVMYPLLVSEAISRRGLQRIRFATPLICALVVVCGAAWVASQRGPAGALPTIASLLAVNAVLQALLHFRAVAAEADGDALWISGIALPANASACAVLVFPWASSAAAAVAMSAALVVGNAVCLVVMTRRRIGQAVLDKAAQRQSGQLGSSWFFARSAIGYACSNLLTSLAVLLPASGLTILSIAAKLAAAASNTLVNAVMPALVHRTTESPAAARRFLVGMTGLLGGLGALAVTVVAISFGNYLAAAVVIALWVISATACSAAQRMAFRFLPASAMAAPTVAVVVITALATVASRAPGFQVLVLLCAYAALDSVTAGILLWNLKDRAMSWLMLGIVLVFSVIAARALV